MFSKSLLIRIILEWFFWRKWHINYTNHLHSAKDSVKKVLYEALSYHKIESFFLAPNPRRAQEDLTNYYAFFVRKTILKWFLLVDFLRAFTCALLGVESGRGKMILFYCMIDPDMIPFWCSLCARKKWFFFIVS